jgi:hypothetical protein
MWNDEEAERARAQGIYNLPPSQLSIALSVDDAYKLIQFLEKHAVAFGSYNDVSEAVRFAEMMRAQVLAQQRHTYARRASRRPKSEPSKPGSVASVPRAVNE